ncbi:hypothetical protein F6Y02_07990 (plasmid) [Bacillus megaterium]|nr:hypothetical protein [Priestia megaterium]
MGCYSIGTAGIIIGAILAYFSLNNISSDKNSYYYIYVGAKNLAIIGLLILCSRYTFNIGNIFMEEGVKQADRLHAIHYGRFFRILPREIIFEEMKDLFKDWNMDSKPSLLNNPDPMAADRCGARQSLAKPWVQRKSLNVPFASPYVFSFYG